MNERISETQEKGVFTAEQLAELVGMINSELFIHREQSADPMPTINPKGILIEYGDQTAALTLDASDEIFRCADDCSAMNVAAWLEAHIESNAQTR